MRIGFAEALLIAAILLLAWTYGGYLGFLTFLSWFRVARPASDSAPDLLPTVTAIIPVYNGGEAITQKLQDMLSLEYPPDRLDILVGSDGSTDATVLLTEACNSPRVKLLAFADRRGRALVCNDAAAATNSEWLLFTDIDARLDRAFLMRMARHFADRAIGVLDGSISCVNEGQSSLARDVGLYWRLESKQKTLESHLGILSSTFGNCTAVRREIYRPLRASEDVDFTVPLEAIGLGYRVVHEPEARVNDLAHSDLRSQFQARVRMVTKNLPGTLRKWPLLWDKPLIGLSIVSHKLLRWFTPILLLLALATNLLLAGQPAYRALLLAQGVFYLLGLLGAIGWLARRQIPLASSIFSFLVAAAGFFVGTLNSLRGIEIAYYRPYRGEVAEPGGRRYGRG